MYGLIGGPRPTRKRFLCIFVFLCVLGVIIVGLNSYLATNGAQFSPGQSFWKVCLDYSLKKEPNFPSTAFNKLHLCQNHKDSTRLPTDHAATRVENFYDIFGRNSLFQRQSAQADGSAGSLEPIDPNLPTINLVILVFDKGSFHQFPVFIKNIVHPQGQNASLSEVNIRLHVLCTPTFCRGLKDLLESWRVPRLHPSFYDVSCDVGLYRPNG